MLPPRNYFPEQLQTEMQTSPSSQEWAILSCGPVTAFSLFALLQNQDLPILQWVLSLVTCSKLSSPKTELTITSCYQEGAVVPNQVGTCTSFTVLRVSSLILFVFSYLQKLKVKGCFKHSAEKYPVSQNQFLCII